MKAAFLSDRGVVKLSGEDARGFLNGLVTTELADLTPGNARFGALLTPQGKITIDFLVTEVPAGHGGGLLLDVPRPLAAAFATKLGFYKLRAKVSVENLSDSRSDGLGVLAIWGGEPAMKPDLLFADPRNAALGWRMLVPSELALKAGKMLGARICDEADYDAHRIAVGTPRGGLDFSYNDAFPHDVNMDRLNGVDFDKGCYVGQEVVSRMKHRGTPRTRVVRIKLDGPAPEVGAPITAGEKSIGVMGSSANGNGLALLRIDRAADALDAELSLSAGGLALHLTDPADIRLPKKNIEQTVA